MTLPGNFMRGEAHHSRGRAPGKESRAVRARGGVVVPRDGVKEDRGRRERSGLDSTSWTTTLDPRVDVFVRREDAFAALEDAIKDEPDWAGLLSVVPIEPDGAGISLN
jgi:hypothetical protein